MPTLVSPIVRRTKKKIYSVENLERFVHCDETLLTPALKAARTRSQNGTCAFYGYLPVEFPIHYRAFRNLHDAELAVGHDVDDAFEMNADGLIKFIIAVGPIPSNLQNPILIRINPSEGFVRGNIRWENARRFRPISARRASAFRNCQR